MDSQNSPSPASRPVKIQSLSGTVSGLIPESAAPSALVQPAAPAAAPVPQAPQQVVVTAPAGPVHFHGASHIAPARQPNAVVRYWRKVGGGSLALSLLIHVGILVGAYFMVQTIVQENKVDFLPGGGSKAGQEASNALSQQVQQKKRTTMNKSMPVRRLVSQSTNAAISLPDAPADSLSLPDTSSLMGGMSGSGGFGKAGAGGGFGTGQGIGGVSGFAPVTFFGKRGGDGLAGTLYDLKQDGDRKPIDYNPNNYASIIAKAADKKFAPAAMKEYYHASQQMSFTFLTVPYMAAEEGPKAFNVEKEVQPRGWYVHYTGVINPPTNGEWRFVGNFDDALVIYINNKCVFDGSWLNIGNHGVQNPDPEIKQAFGGPPVLTGAQHCYAGKWVRFTGPAKIDIVVGERPGGRVGGLLLVQNKKGKYRERPDGSPILPVFTTTKPDVGDIERMKQFINTKPVFELELENIPVFEVKKSMMDESPLDRMRAGGR